MSTNAHHPNLVLSPNSLAHRPTIVMAMSPPNQPNPSTHNSDLSTTNLVTEVTVTKRAQKPTYTIPVSRHMKKMKQPLKMPPTMAMLSLLLPELRKDGRYPHLLQVSRGTCQRKAVALHPHLKKLTTLLDGLIIWVSAQIQGYSVRGALHSMWCKSCSCW